jgi:4-hydroxybenzoate polyprenyltransferase
MAERRLNRGILALIVTPADARRIFIDVDSLLVGSSLTTECLLEALRRHPAIAWRLPFWAMRGNAVLQQKLAQSAEMDVAALPYDGEALEELRRSAADGGHVVLVTSADPSLARKVAAHLGIVDVAAGQASPRRRGSLRWIPRTLRPYQWLKNALVFLPFLLSHEVNDGGKWVAASLLFFAFSFCASAGYIVNDILDRSQDRLHPRRRSRPIAAGEAPLTQAIWLPLPLVASAALCCAFLPPYCALALAGYLVMTLLYSTVVKNLVIADVLLLALLYLLRLLAGSVATRNAVSHWLLAFALTLFLSLALSKRVSELCVWRSVDHEGAPGRKYRADDIPVLQMMAVSSGFLACLIMVLYIQSPEILRLYRRPECLWVGVVALLYWLGRLFIYSHRGECPDDPLLFVVQDRTTLVVLAVAGTFALLAV